MADLAYSNNRLKFGRVVKKVCPVITRRDAGVAMLLAFQHPTAGKQLVKGSIEEGECPREAAIRELAESGVIAAHELIDLGEAPVGSTVWHFFAVEANGLPANWTHQTREDFGHTFSFFWHPLCVDFDDEWHHNSTRRWR